MIYFAAVAELADAQDLKSCGGNIVPVRFRSAALHLINTTSVVFVRLFYYIKTCCEGLKFRNICTYIKKYTTKDIYLVYQMDNTNYNNLTV